MDRIPRLAHRGEARWQKYKGRENSMKKILSACLGFVLLGAIATGNVLAAPLVWTDSSWKVRSASTAPSYSLYTNGDWTTGDWNSSLTFDDSGWNSATELYDLNALGYPQYSPAKGIWDGPQYDTAYNTQMWARFVFNLSSLPLSALLTNGFDDDGDIYINGTLVVSDHNGYANNSTADITSYLVLGDNLIAYTVADNYAYWNWYNHSSWVHVDAVAASAPEPETYAMLGLGLGLMGWMAKRKKQQAA